MHQVIARYKAAERADENLELFAVYDELSAPSQPVCATRPSSSMTASASSTSPKPTRIRTRCPRWRRFQEFQREIADRCEEQPQVTEIQEVGAYRF